MRRKHLVSAIAAILLTVMLVGCTVQTTENGYVIEVGQQCVVSAPNMAQDLIYQVVEQPEGEKYENLIREARSKISEWWGQETFQEPKDIIWIKVIQGNILGFQDSEYLFVNVVDIEEEYANVLATVIHEWIHLQNPDAFCDNDGVKTELQEMVVEAATVDILGQKNMEYTTPCYDFFKESRNLYSKKEQLIKLYKEQQGIPVSRVCELLGWDYDAVILLNAYQGIKYLDKASQEKFYGLVGK